MSFGFGINNLGQVTGQSYLPGDGQDRAFLYSNGIMQSLGTLPGDSLSLGRAINDLGQVTGTSTGISTSYAILYSNGVMKSLGSFGGNTSAAFGINNAGQITGYAYYANGPSHAFLYSNGTMRDIGTLGGGSGWGNSINASGQVTGTADLPNGKGHAFLYSNGSMTDLGTLGGTFSGGKSINNAGQIVGSSAITATSITSHWFDAGRIVPTPPISTAGLETHAFFYADGVMQDLGTLGGTSSTALAINNSGQILGVSSLPGDATSAPFLYQGGTMYNLMSFLKPGSGVTSLSLSDNGLNDFGEIAATAIINGHEDAVLLTPIVVQPRSIVSRVTQGNAGTFDLSLPQQGSPAIECRSGGPNGNFIVVFTFTLPLTTVDGAVVSAGTGSVAASTIDPNDAHNYVVNLTGVANAQTITIRLSNVNNTAGASAAVISADIGFLLGDINGDGIVNVGDTILVRNQSGNVATASNFRQDVNADGIINVGDTIVVRNQSGTALSPQSGKPSRQKN